MRNISIVVFLMCIISILAVSQCTDNRSQNQTSLSASQKSDFGGYQNKEKWGEHLVTVGACHDCHTPKKLTAQGLELDSSKLLSGHPAHLPPPAVNREELESKALILTGDLTAWIGPWGISYTANLTSDTTGIGNWKEEQFLYAIREGKYKGLANSRPLLPPMPWQMYRNMTDDELKAIFAYLKSTKPIKNVVPPPHPPVSAE